MEIIRTIEWMKQASRAARQAGRSIGFVPTMGALHEGHLSLVRAAMAEHRPVVVSIFVNPAQFGPQEDLSKYPRQIEKDTALLEELGVDYVFIPEAGEIYPAGFRTHVNVEGLSERLEGASRPGHFRGVTTVVLKLFQIVQPAAAFFGRKDAQQARILQQMARDLNLDTEIIVGPIVREADGLAMSSRNEYLGTEERRAATALSRGLTAAASAIGLGERDAAVLMKCVRGALDAEPQVRADYVQLVDEENFDVVKRLDKTCLLLVAAYVGKAKPTRLIDNLLITPDGAAGFRTTL